MKILQNYLHYLSIEKDLSTNTIEGYKSRFLVFHRWLKKRQFNEKNCKDFLYYLKQKDTPNSYIIAFIFFFRSFCDFLKLKKNFAKDIPLLRVEKYLPETLTVEQIRSILTCQRKYRLIKTKIFWDLVLALLAKTGCRVGEIVTLKVKDLNLSEEFIHLRETKTDEDRLVPIAPELVIPLGNFIKDKSDEDFVFSVSPKSVNKELKLRAEFLGIKCCIHAHLFRHSFITELLRQDVSVLKVAQIVGHRQLKTTQHYTHLILTDLKNAIRRHPLISESESPKELLKRVKENIESFRINEDCRFEYRLTENSHGLKIEIQIR